VSPIGLGTVKLGRNVGVKYPGSGSGPSGGYALPTDDEATELLRTAAEVGVSLIDTAPAYGTSEERIGSLMTANGWFGGRDRWVVCTKAGEEFDVASGQSRFDFSPAGVRASVVRSLRRLRVESLDVVLLHSDGRDEWIIGQSGAMGALQDLKRGGPIRATGISVKSAAGGMLALEHGFDVVMVTYNSQETNATGVIEAAHAHRAGPRGVLVKKALASGHAADAGAALRLALGVKGVSSVVVGTISPAHLRANADAVE
jgi:aryl-alcohol dehydrogenase-like predicted oxidoreductase